MAPTAPADVNAGRYGSGHSVRRIEDPTLVTGTGRYVDDVSLPGHLHLVMLRSSMWMVLTGPVALQRHRVLGGAA